MRETRLGRFVLCSLMILSSLAMVRPAFAQSTTAGVRLEAGIAKEEVDGDLKSAMAIYQKIAADSSAPREVRAKALLRLGGCYEKLGRQARQVYEQIVHDFADQPAAAQARSRLASLTQQEHPAPPATMTLRKIERFEWGGMGASDTDGQRAVYVGSDGNLFFGDLAGRSKRMIFKVQPNDRPGFFPSRDFSMSTIAFAMKPNRPATLAVVKTDGTDYRELVRDDAQGTILGSNWQEDVYWSWDDRYLLVPSKPETGRSHLWMISVADGQRRELLGIETGEIGRAVFSPDGRFVAYEVAPDPGQVGAFRIFIVPAEGGEPRLVYESDPRSRQPRWAERWELMDWTADSRYLAIADTRDGKAPLYLFPIKNGASAGAPVLVRHGNFRNGYTTATGALVYEAEKPGGNTEIHLASFDLDGHMGRWRRLNLGYGNPFNPTPSFSPDGSQIAYVARDEDMAGGGDLVLHNLSTGQERVLYRSGEDLLSCQFATHVPTVFCVLRRTGGTTDLVSVAVESGAVERLASFPKVRWIVGASQDDHALYLMEWSEPRAAAGEAGPLVRWELATGKETVVSVPTPHGFYIPSLDYRWLVKASGKSLSVRPISGGDWKPLASFVGPGPGAHFVTTGDGNWVLYQDTDLTGKQSLFRVPITGGQPERLGDFPSKDQSGHLRFSGDGRQIVAVTFSPTRYELWILENFVPSSAKSSTGGAQ